MRLNLRAWRPHRRGPEGPDYATFTSFLRHLRVELAEIADAGAKNLPRHCTQLTSLNLINTRITDEGLRSASTDSPAPKTLYV